MKQVKDDINIRVRVKERKKRSDEQEKDIMRIDTEGKDIM